jgi:hypothetical protein
MYGEAAILALLLIQYQDRFYSEAMVYIVRSGEGDGWALEQLRDLFSFRKVEPSCRLHVFGEIPSSVDDPKYEVRCNGQWASGSPLAASRAADFAVRIALTCRVDFGGRCRHMGSEQVALLDARLEVLGPSTFQLTTSTIASAEFF